MSKNSLDKLESAINFVTNRKITGSRKNYLKALSKFIGDLLVVDYVLIVKYTPEKPDIAESVALYTPEGWAANVIYNLRDTPCDNIIGCKMCVYESDIQQLFPKDELLIEMDVDSYLGIPLWGEDGTPIGLIALMNKGELTDIKTMKLVLKSVSTSAGGELERIIHDNKLQLSNNRLNLLLKSSEDMITIHEPNGKYIYYNGPSSYNLGPEEIIGKMPSDLLGKEAAETLNKAFQKVMQNGQSETIEVLLDWPEKRRWYSEYIYPVKTALGTVVEIVKVCKDIHQRKISENEVEKKNKQLNALNIALNQAQRLSHIGSWNWNMATDEAEWSDEMYNIYGVTKENFYPSNENVTKTVVSEDLPKIEAGIGSLLNNQIFKPFEFRIKRPNGEIRDLYIVALEKDSQTNIFGVTQDITDRKKAEKEIEKQNKILIESEKQLQALNEEYLTLNEELNESNNQLLNTIKASEADKNYLDKIINNIGDPIFVKDDQSRLIIVNDAFSRLFNISKEHAIGKTLAEDVSPEERDSFLKIDKEVLATGIEFVNEETLTISSSQTRSISTRKTRFINSDGRKFLVGVTRDITKSKIAEQEIEEKNKILIESEKQLQLLNEELKESNYELCTAADKITRSLKEKELLLRELYHRTKNNMQIISSMLSIKSLYTNNEHVKEILKETKSKIMGMALVHQKLYQANDLSWIDLKDYLKDLVELLKVNLIHENSNIEVVTHFENTLTNLDTAIPCGLIINELFTNAIKYAYPNNENGIIKIQLLNTGDNEIRILVSDNGVGFPPKLDFRNSNSYGLEAVIMLAEVQLGGTISLQSGDGTEFTIQFEETLKADRI